MHEKILFIGFFDDSGGFLKKIKTPPIKLPVDFFKRNFFFTDGFLNFFKKSTGNITDKFLNFRQFS